MAQVKTYILAPNFQHKPDGALQIGNIIADPFRPAKVLSKASIDKSLAIESIIEYSHESSMRKERRGSIGVWSQFLQFIGTDVNLSLEINSSAQYTIDRLETHYLRDEPLDNDADLMKRLAEPRVRTAIKAGLFGRQPVYMISGIKIARGLTVRTETGKAKEFGVASTVPINESISARAGVNFERRDDVSSSFKAGSDVVFAYQLHKICQKGKDNRRTATIGVLESKAAFLHDDDEEKEEIDGRIEFASVSLATPENLMDMEEEDEDLDFKTFEIINDDGLKTIVVTPPAENVL